MEKEKSKNWRRIYKMELGEIQEFDFIKVLRVPGGWIFVDYDRHKKTIVFVPWNDEFQEDTTKLINE